MKYYLKLLLAAGLYYSGIERLLRYLVPRRSVAIFMLHSVQVQNPLTRLAGFSMDVKRFERRIRFLRRYPCISMTNVADALAGRAPLPRNAVVITFDDGYADNYLQAFPILNRYSLPATVYLTTDYIGSGQWLPMNKLYDAIWRTSCETFVVPPELRGLVNLPDAVSLTNDADRQTLILSLRGGLKRLATDQFEPSIEAITSMLLSSVRCERGAEFDMLNWDQIEAMAGLIEFGSHTASHTIVARASEARQETEIACSTKLINERLGKVTHFAYPNGHQEDYDERSIRLLAKHGYRTAVTTEVGSNDSASDPYRLRRMGLESPNCVIALELLGITDWLRTRIGARSSRSFTGAAA